MRLFFIWILIFSFPLLCFGNDTKLKRGIDELESNNLSQAEELFYKASEESPSFVTFYNLGVVSGKLGDWAKAKWAFESALKFNPSNGDAQYNAKFASEKLTGQPNWTHPYSWNKRLIVGLGIYTWLGLEILSAIIIGLSFFFILSKKDEKSKILTWSKRLIVPASIIFVLAFYCIIDYTRHFTVHQYAILKYESVKRYISPNGIELSDENTTKDRFYLLEYAEDSTWVQVSSVDDVFWVKSNDLFVY